MGSHMLNLGIDFGTSTTVAAACDDAGVEVVRNAAGQEITASYVALMPDASVTFGRAARARRVIDARNTLFAFKRILGRPWGSPEVRNFGEQYPFELECGSNNTPRFVTRAGKLTPVDVTGSLLTYLRESPMLMNQALGNVAMTVPVSFRPEQRSALMTAGLTAGFKDIKLLEEPCAAALACLPNNSAEQLVVVYDLGGGTFDVTIFKWSPKGYEVLAVGGDSFLGGDDITNSCAKWLSAQVLERFHWNIRSSENSYQRLVLLCEAAKIALSFATAQEFDLAYVDEVLKGKTLTITREHLESISLALVQRSFVICDEVLRSAGIAPNQANAVVLAGGGCYMPFVRSSVQLYFDQMAKVDLAPDRVVAAGAALYAAGRSAFDMDIAAVGR